MSFDRYQVLDVDPGSRCNECMEDGCRAFAIRVSKLGYVEFETPDVDRMVD